jgi:hypothetical protein
MRGKIYEFRRDYFYNDSCGGVGIGNRKML